MELLTVSEAAAYLRVSKSFIYRATAAGRLAHFKIGSANRYSREKHLDPYIASLEVQPVTGKVEA